MSTPNDVIALRDYFAAAALSGAVASHMAAVNAMPDSDLAQKAAKEAALNAASKTIARLAYDYAEDVIAERGKRVKAQEVAIAA